MKRLNFLVLTLVATALLTLSACSDGGNDSNNSNTSDPNAVTGITVTPDEIRVVSGQNATQAISVTIEPATADQSYTLASLDNATATVDTSTGIVRGVANGDTYIRVTSTADTSVTTDIPVFVTDPIPVTGLTLSYSPQTINVDETTSPTFGYVPNDTTDIGVTYSIDNTSIATINDTTGEVTGEDQGIAKITITSTVDSNIFAEFTISVLDPNFDICTDTTNTTGYNNVGGTWQIYNAHGLTNYATEINSNDNTVDATLICDISLTGEWTPIGNATDNFSGTFDGGDYTVTGLNMTQNITNKGLFGVVGVDGSVSNFNIEGAEISANSVNAAVAGISYGTISDISVNMATISGDNSLAGAIARNYGTATNISVNNSTINGSSNDAGGIVAINYAKMVNVSTTNTSVTGNSRVGGVVGYNDGSIYATKATNVDINVLVSNYGGGVVGDNSGTLVAAIADDIDFTTSATSSRIGGIVGWNEGRVITSFANNITPHSGSSNRGGVAATNFSGSFDNVLYATTNPVELEAVADTRSGSDSSGASKVASITLLNNEVDIINTALDAFRNSDEEIGYRFQAGNPVATALPTLLELDNSVAPQSIAIVYNETSLLRGTSAMIESIVFTPANTGQRDVKFSVADGDKANIIINPTTGEVTALQESTVTITATSSANSSASDTGSIVIAENNQCTNHSGDGYTRNPATGIYEIYNGTGLAGVSTEIAADKTINARLACDIDMTGITIEPMGDYISTASNDPYVGTFDGRHFTISNLTINSLTEDGVALFGVIGDGGVVKNLYIDNPTITGDEAVGGIVGHNLGMIKNVHVNGGTITAKATTGGIVGINHGSAYQVSVIGTTINASGGTGDHEVGGIAGRHSGSNARLIGAISMPALIEGSTSTTKQVGGLVGSLFGSLIDSQIVNTIIGTLTHVTDFELKQATDAFGAIAGFANYLPLDGNYSQTDLSTANVGKLNSYINTDKSNLVQNRADLLAKVPAVNAALEAYEETDPEVDFRLEVDGSDVYFVPAP